MTIDEFLNNRQFQDGFLEQEISFIYCEHNDVALWLEQNENAVLDELNIRHSDFEFAIEKSWPAPNNQYNLKVNVSKIKSYN